MTLFWKRTLTCTLVERKCTLSVKMNRPNNGYNNNHLGTGQCIMRTKNTHWENKSF